MKTTIFFFVRESFKSLLENSKIESNVSYIFVDSNDNLTDYEELKRNNNIHFVIDVDSYINNEDYFRVIRNYYSGNFILINDSTTIFIEATLFDIKTDIDNISNIIPLIEKIDVLESYISLTDKHYVNEKVSLTNAYYSHIQQLEVVNTYGVTIDFFHSVGKSRFSNIFWLKNRWNKLLFLDIDVGKSNTDFLTLMLIKDWEIFYEKSKELAIDSYLLEKFVIEVSEKYAFLDINTLHIVLASIGSFGVDYFSYNYENALDLTVNGELLFICGLDQTLFRDLDLNSMDDVYSVIESNILQIEESSISSKNQYAFVFKLANFNSAVETKYNFVDVIDNTGIVKFFELSHLNYIIDVAYNKVMKVLVGISEAYQDVILKNIKMVLREIIINSIEHGLEKNVCGTVYFHYYLRNDRIVFTVEDTGKGFQHDLRALDNDSRRGKGLFLIDNIVDDIYFNENGNLVRVEFDINKWRNRA